MKVAKSAKYVQVSHSTSKIKFPSEVWSTRKNIQKEMLTLLKISNAYGAIK